MKRRAAAAAAAASGSKRSSLRAATSPPQPAAAAAAAAAAPAAADGLTRCACTVWHAHQQPYGRHRPGSRRGLCAAARSRCPCPTRRVCSRCQWAGAYTGAASAEYVRCARCTAPTGQAAARAGWQHAQRAQRRPSTAQRSLARALRKLLVARCTTHDATRMMQQHTCRAAVAGITIKNGAGP